MISLSTPSERWLGNPKMSAFESKVISDEIQDIAARLAQETKRRQLYFKSHHLKLTCRNRSHIQQKQQERREKCLSSKSKRGKQSPHEVGFFRIKPNQTIVPHDAHRILHSPHEYHRRYKNISKMSGSTTPAAILSISHLEQNGETEQDGPLMRSFSSRSLAPKTLVQEYFDSDEEDHIKLLDITPEVHDPKPKKASTITSILVKKEGEKWGSQVKKVQQVEQKRYVADSNGKSCHWDPNETYQTQKDSEIDLYMDMSQKPSSMAHSGSGSSPLQDLSSSLPEYPSMSTLHESKSSLHSKSTSRNFEADIHRFELRRQSSRKKSIFAYANPVVAKQKEEQEAKRELIRKNTTSCFPFDTTPQVVIAVNEAPGPPRKTEKKGTITHLQMQPKTSAPTIPTIRSIKEKSYGSIEVTDLFDAMDLFS